MPIPPPLYIPRIVYQKYRLARARLYIAITIDVVVVVDGGRDRGLVRLVVAAAVVVNVVVVVVVVDATSAMLTRRYDDIDTR